MTRSRRSTRLGGDVVVKPVFGAEGRGMQRVSDRELAWRTFRVLEQTGQLIYQQRFIAHPGHDLRVFVMGGKVRAAMRRSSGATTGAPTSPRAARPSAPN